MERKVDQHNPSLQGIIDFILFLHDEFTSSNALSQYVCEMRKDLSPQALHRSYDSTVTEILKSSKIIKRSIPTIPKTAWDADVVLDHLLTLPPDNQLTLVQMSGKVALLLLLASGRRRIDLTRLNISSEHMTKTNDGYYFALDGFSKTNSWTPSIHQNMQYMEFTRYPHESRLCPYTAISNYLNLVRNRTPSRIPDHNSLFVITTLAATPASTDTLKRWIITIMHNAGVDTYRNFSTRAAHASKSAQMNDTIENIMNRCAWTKESTFYKHYLRPIQGTTESLANQCENIRRRFFCKPKTVLSSKDIIPIDAQHKTLSEEPVMPRSLREAPTEMPAETVELSQKLITAIVNSQQLGQPPSDDEWEPPRYHQWGPLSKLQTVLRPSTLKTCLHPVLITLNSQMMGFCLFLLPRHFKMIDHLQLLRLRDICS